MKTINPQEGIREDAFRLLNYINTWKKLAILMVMVVFFGVCYVGWEQRRELSFWLMSTYGTPQVDNAIVDTEAVQLMNDIDGKSVAVWSLELNQNKRSAIYFRVADRRINHLEGTADLALRPYSEYSANIIKTITQKTLCVPLIVNTVIGEMEKKEGVSYVCYAAIPPSHGTMIGLLVVGFAQKPHNEDYVKVRMISAAQRIIK
jgi:hypothetical protein